MRGLRAALRLLDIDPELFLALPVAVVHGPHASGLDELARPRLEALMPRQLRTLQPAGGFSDIHLAYTSWQHDRFARSGYSGSDVGLDICRFPRLFARGGERREQQCHGQNTWSEGVSAGSKHSAGNITPRARGFLFARAQKEARSAETMHCRLRAAPTIHQSEETMKQHTEVMTKDRLAEQFQAVATDTEQLINSVATAGGEQAGALRDRAEQGLADMRNRLRDLRNAATDKIEAASDMTDEYVRENPWKAIGMAAGLTVAAGVVVGLLLNRR